MNGSRVLTLSLLGALLASVDAQAVGLRFDHRFASDAEQTAVLSWGSRALSMLPPSMHDRLPHTIRVRFRSWGPGDAPLAEPLCAGESSASDTSVHRAYARYGRYNSVRNIISINSRLLPEIVRGPSGTRGFGCYHGDFYRLALATLMHEIAHAYDALDLDARVGKSVKRSRATRTTVSDDPLWKAIDLANRNRDRDRLPARHAGANRRESFAVHFEYFLLDPEYRCRYPSHHEFLETHFGWSPPGGDCVPAFEVVARKSTGAVNLDPDRVYQVRYLHASPGRKIASKLGHSMLHFVLCAPGTPRSPECLKQEEEDLVLGFAARSDESPWHSLKGLVGIYDSMIFFTSLRYQLQTYNQFQMRDVVSYALDLDREQIRRLTLRALELYWTYRGPYRFLSNNCATETEDLLKAGSLNESYIFGDRRTPGGVLRHLSEIGLIDETREPIVYKSGLDATRQAAADLYGVAGLRRRKAVERWVESLSYDDRRAVLERLRGELESLRRLDAGNRNGASAHADMRKVVSLGQQLESFRMLEENIAHAQDNKLGGTRLRELKRLARGDDRKSDLVSRFEFLVQSILSGDRDGARGYGIPLRGETGADVPALGRELEAIQERVTPLMDRSIQLARWRREAERTRRLADRRFDLLMSYAALARDVRTRVVMRAINRFPTRTNSEIRSMLEERFGDGAFEPTRFSDARMDRLRMASSGRRSGP